MSDVRDLLERGVRGFEPSGHALERTLQKVRRRQRRRRIGTAIVALGITSGVVAGLWAAFLDPQGQEERAPAGPISGPTPTETDTTEATEACPPQPFVATAVPEGFSREPRSVHEPGPIDLASIAEYSGEPGRNILVRRMPGSEEPAFPLTDGKPISVVGSDGLIGAIHEGFGVQFSYGDDACNRYSIEAYGVSKADLRAFAEGLRPG